jgi:uncharacterized membrane protein (UPF0127 family)
MRRLICALGAVAALLGLPGCGGTGSAAVPTTSARGFALGDLSVQHAGGTVLSLTVEIADTPAAREKGLMGVQQLSDSQGMVFVWPHAQNAQFWMKDTLIPLDIAFWDGTDQVVDMQAMTPCTADPCPTYASASPYVAAVEVRGGLLSKVGVHSGDAMRFTRRAPSGGGAATASP